MTAGELLYLLHWLLCLIDTTQLKCQHVYLGVKTYNVKALVKTRACWWISVGDLGEVLLLAAVWTLDLTHNQENTHGWIGKRLFLSEGRYSRWHMHTVLGFLVNFIITTPALWTSSVLFNRRPENNIEKTHSPTGLHAYFTCTARVIKIEATSTSLRQSDRDTGQDWYCCLGMVVMDVRITAARQSLLMLSQSQRGSSNQRKTVWLFLQQFWHFEKIIRCKRTPASPQNSFVIHCLGPLDSDDWFALCFWSD